MKQGIILPPEDDEEARAVLALCVKKGVEEAEELLLGNGLRMIAAGDKGVASAFMDVSVRFRTFARQGGKEQFFSVATMLRRIAQRLHKKQPAQSNDPRFLRLVADNDSKEMQEG